jgi:uncharacterized protein (DUF2062 family)
MSPAATVPAPETAQAEKKPGFWQRRFVQPIKVQLTQGVTPKALSHAISVGFLCAIFPILGMTTLLTTLSGFVFRLNQPVMQTINWFGYPLQLALIPLFIRGGEFLFGAEPISFSIPQMLKLFAESPGGFMTEFAMTFVHCIVAWTVVAPFLGAIIFLVARPLLGKAEKTWRSAKPND